MLNVRGKALKAMSLKAALQNLFRQEAADHDSSSDPIAREIRGSIWALLGLFELISLTSYLPLDSLNLFGGRFDHIHNLGGIVGAALSELCLGSVGVMGYSIILITGALSVCAFMGKPLREIRPQILGGITSSALGAIACHLFFSKSYPEASLLQGGIVGVRVGTLLETALNTTGALILVSGMFLVILMLTAGLSLIQLFREAFPEERSEEDESQEEESPKEKSQVAAPAANVVALPATPSKKPRKRKAVAKTDGEDGEATTASSEEEESSPDTATPTGPKVFTMQEMVPFSGTYSLPSPRLLKGDSGGSKKMSKGELKQNIQKLIEHLLSFQITGEIVEVTQGPVLTTYEFKPSAGVKLSKIASLQEDLGIVLGTRELRIVAPIPGKTVVGIEVPRPQAETISLKELVADKGFNDKKIRIPVVLGKATDGTPAIGDLAGMPHLLVAGQTGSGKSVFVNSLIMSFLYRLTPHQLRLILVDPKMLELNVFDGLPHLLTNVITDNKLAFNALTWAVWEMDRRYGLMAKTGSKNIDSYNEKMKSASDKLPYIVIVVDELADLMMSGGEMVETAITRLAQKARAAGLHLVIATQRPSTDVVTGLIKANIPSRLAFKVPSGIDSRTVLDTGGAEDLIGRGDSLMTQPAVPLRRLHGCFVSEEELKRVVKYCINGKNYQNTYMDFSGKNPSEEE